MSDASNERWQKARRALEQGECLCSEAQVAAAYDRLAARIAPCVRDLNPVVLCVMIGGLVPTAELIRRFDFPFELDYLHATRYRGETTGTDLHWKAGPGIDVGGRHVLVVDDILDEGDTLTAILNRLRRQAPQSLLSAVLVEKQHGRRDPALKADFTGLRVADRYLYGCGLDYLGYLRQVSGIYTVPEYLL
jgi:hypoxanthine phosphoribosyltransferase